MVRRDGDRAQRILSPVLAEAFALDARESQRIVDDLLGRPGGSGAAAFSVHLAGPGEDAALLSLQVAADVFLRAFGNTPDLLRREYADLVPSMCHVVVLDRTARTAVGSLILQAAPAGELKTILDVAQPPWSVPAEVALTALGLSPDDTTAADLLLLSVQPGYRRHGLGTLLLYSGWVASAGMGLDRWTATLDEPLLRGLRAMSGGAVRPIAGAPSRPYLGSAGSIPITLRMRPAEDGLLLRRIQDVGRRAAAHAEFCGDLERGHRGFQALIP
jgi:GNAT superfamily N-acetyltransferase